MVSQNPPTQPIARLEHRYFAMPVRKMVGGCQTGQARTNYDAFLVSPHQGSLRTRLDCWVLRARGMIAGLG